MHFTRWDPPHLFNHQLVVCQVAASVIDVGPTVGFIPTRLLTLDGESMLSSVGVPKAAVANPFELPTQLPDKLLLGLIRTQSAGTVWTVKICLCDKCGLS